MLVAVNYHYVGGPEYPYPAIRSISEKDFLEQVFWLRKHFTLIGIPELVQALQGGTLPENACMITFDDGLRCHYEVVMPLMEKHGFPAAFFISTEPLVSCRAAMAHRGQYVRANTPPDRFEEMIAGSLKKRGRSIFDFTLDAEQIRKHYRYDDPGTARIKYLINYLLPHDVSGEIIEDCFKQLVGDEALFCRQWYMTEAQVGRLHNRYGCIGSHAASHRALASLKIDEALQELRQSKRELERITQQPILGLSYPLGNPEAVGRREAALAEQSGYCFAFTMEREINRCLADSLLLARIDCNDLPVGKAPCFSLGEKGTLQQSSGEISKRRLYYAE